MVWFVSALLLAVWLLGMVTGTTLGGFVHVLLIIAVILFAARILRGGAPVH